MLKHKVRLNFNGFNISETVEAETPEQWVTNIRNQVAGRLKGLMLSISPAARKLKENLDVDGKDDWTEQEFFTAITGYYNSHMRRDDAPIEYVPANCEAFIAQCVRLGIARREV